MSAGGQPVQVPVYGLERRDPKKVWAYRLSVAWFLMALAIAISTLYDGRQRQVQAVAEAKRRAPVLPSPALYKGPMPDPPRRTKQPHTLPAPEAPAQAPMVQAKLPPEEMWLEGSSPLVYDHELRAQMEQAKREEAAARR